MIALSALRRVAVAALFAAVAAAPLAAQESAPKPDVVVAEVNGEKILMADLLATYRSLPQRLQQVPFEQLYKPLLEHAISIRLLASEGRKAKLEESEAVKARIKYLENQYVYEAYVEKIVNERSTDAKMKEAYEAYVKEFSEALTKLTPGQVTANPVKTQFGWHIIQLVDARTQQGPSFDELKPQLAQRIQGAQLDAYLSKLKQQAKVE